MGIIIILIILSLIIATGFLKAFYWAVRSGQYEDTDAPAVRMLFDEPTDKDDISQP